MIFEIRVLFAGIRNLQIYFVNCCFRMLWQISKQNRNFVQARIFVWLGPHEDHKIVMDV